MREVLVEDELANFVVKSMAPLLGHLLDDIGQFHDRIGQSSQLSLKSLGIREAGEAGDEMWRRNKQAWYVFHQLGERDLSCRKTFN